MGDTNPKKRNEPPSSKGKVNVKETTSKFDSMAAKYCNQRNLKDINKEKGKFKRTAKRQLNETIEDPLTKWMKEMRDDIKEMKGDVKGNKSKLDDLSKKVENLETKRKEADETNSNTFQEMKDEISLVEERVTTKLMKEIKPSLNTMKNEIQDNVNLDIRRLIKEEMALQKLAEAKDKKKERPKEDVSEETEKSEVDEEHAKGEPAKKSKKSKKYIKIEKPKKMRKS